MASIGASIPDNYALSDVEVEVIGEWVFAVGVDWRSVRSGNDEDREYDEYKGFVVAEIVAI